ncbi:MAG: HAD-IIIA family hydrolase [Bacteroidota bacterium]
MNKCIFLDRDGVLNKDRVNYAYDLDHFIILDGAIEGLRKLKDAGYFLVVITNQSGIAKGVYTREQMNTCHQYLQERCGHIIDHIYYSPYHPITTESLTRKPDSLMFEKAMAKFETDVANSWMIGDKERDIIPAKKVGLKTIQVGEYDPPSIADFESENLLTATEIILP